MSGGIVPWRRRAVWILQVARDHQLQPAALHVAIAIASHVFEKTLTAFPSRQKLVEATGLAMRTVDAQIDALKMHGHLTSKPNGQKPAMIKLIIDHSDLHDDAVLEGVELHGNAVQGLHGDAVRKTVKTAPQCSQDCILPSISTGQVSVSDRTSPSEPRYEPRARGHAHENLPSSELALPGSAAFAATAADASALPADGEAEKSSLFPDTEHRPQSSRALHRDGAEPPASPSAEAQFFRDCRSTFGAKDGGWIGKRLLDAKGSFAAAHGLVDAAATKGDPKAWVIAAASGGSRASASDVTWGDDGLPRGGLQHDEFGCPIGDPEDDSLEARRHRGEAW